MEKFVADYKIVGENQHSSIFFTDESMLILRKKGNKSFNPIGVITIIPGIQLELGRRFDEFAKCLKEIRKPLGIQRISQNKEQSTYYIIRFATGKVPEARVCSITVLNGIIASVSFDPDLPNNKEYIRYQKLSMMHQIVAGREDTMSIMSKAISAIALITGEKISEFKMKSTSHSIVVYTDSPHFTYQYAYTFAKDKRGYFSLLSIGFVANKS